MVIWPGAHALTDVQREPEFILVTVVPAKDQ